MQKNTGIIVGGALALAFVAGLTWRGSDVQAQSAPAPAPTRIAVVDMIGIVDKLMSSGSFKAARDQFDAAQSGKQQQIRAAAEALSADAAKRTEEAKADDEKAKIKEETDGKMSMLQTQFQGMQKETDQFTVNTLADAFMLATETAGTIARARGYTHVLASRTGEIPRDREAQLAFQEILLRHVAVLPAGDDLTKDVEKELKLDIVPVIELPAAGPVPAPAGPPAQAPPEAPRVVPAPAPTPK